MEFATALAWIFGVLSTALFIARVIGAFTYSTLDKIRDNLNGYQREFPIFMCGSVALICWTWVLIN